MVEWYWWAGFIAVIAALLFLDLGVLHRKAHKVEFREALLWSAFWVSLALGFGVVVWAGLGGQLATEYFAGYLIEWSLSVDNIFVFVLIISHFDVPPQYQQRVLLWGVIGAVVLRLGFILGGSALIHSFEWAVYVFGALLLITAIRFLKEKDQEEDISFDNSLTLRGMRRVIPMIDDYEGQQMFVRRDGRRVATPLLAVLLLITVTDVVFAVDSIPAIFGVTRDAFIAFSSNMLAVMGLRPLYFVLAGAMGRFRYLKVTLAAILGFVAFKMLAHSFLKIPVGLSLGVVFALLVTGIVTSLLVSRGGAEKRGPAAKGVPLAEGPAPARSSPEGPASQSTGATPVPSGTEDSRPS